MTDKRGHGTRREVKYCECGRPVESTHNRATKCNLCKAADPYRHRGRVEKKFEIAVAVDTEGHQDPDGIMHFITASYGREDGTSDTLMAPIGKYLTGFEVARWLLESLTGDYKDTRGNLRTQVPIGFHLKWDSAVMAKDYALDETCYLIHKKGKTGDDLTPLCGTDPDVEHDCEKLHRFSTEACRAVLDNGEKDLVIFHPESKTAFVFSPGRRMYFEDRPHGDRYDGGRSLDIHDVGTAFTGSLLKVIEAWAPELSEEQQAIIEWGKAARKGDVFADADRDKVKQYSEAECVATARCARKLVSSLKAAFHMPMRMTDLYGSGSVAAIALQHFGVCKREMTHEDTDPFMGNTLWDLARLTYFGGQIEAPVVGYVPGVIDEVDINSAYPAQAIKLPCMRSGHGHWARHRRYNSKVIVPADVIIGYVRVSWTVDTPSSPPFSVRLPNGSVRTIKTCPDAWVTLPEYRAAVAHFGDYAVQAKSMVWWHQDCECPPPLAQLADAYQKRAEIKAEMKKLVEGTAAWKLLDCQQMAIKLVLNSVYGKLAQQDPELGPYTNMHYAAYVTGATRAMVRVETWAQEARGGLVVYQHTDSVLSQGGDPEDRGKDLGAWGLEEPSENMLILQPGLAVAFGGHKKMATRGVNGQIFKATATEWTEENDFTQHPSTWTMVINQESMMSWGYAYSWNCIEKAGSFNPQTKNISLDSDKRDMGNAVQLPCGTAWKVPPVDYVPAIATVNDLLVNRSKLERYLEKKQQDNVGKVR